MHTNIFIFGDSVAFGQYDSAGGWAQRLNAHLMDKYLASDGDEFYVYNLSISGERSQEVILRFDSEMAAREDGKKNIVIFAIGLNDSAYVHSKKEYWLAMDDFKSNLRKLAEMAKKKSKAVVFLGLYPINEGIMDPMPYDLDKSYHNDDVERYDRELKIAAGETGVNYISVFDVFLAQDYEKLLHDGAHPNSEGHQIIFEIVKNYLLEKKII